jgi:hypothetical protein
VFLGWRISGGTRAHRWLMFSGAFLWPWIRGLWSHLEVAIPKVILGALEPFSFVVYIGFSKLLICFGKVPDTLDNPKDPDQNVDW